MTTENSHQDRKLIEEIANEKYIDEILFSSNDVKIYTIHVNGKVNVDAKKWNTDFPFRFIYLDNENVWRRCSVVSPTFDVAFLTYLQFKYLEPNEQFVIYAMRMLKINSSN